MFTLTVVTPHKRLLVDVEVEELFVPAQRGELNVLPGHAPLVSTLTTGIVRYRTAGSTELKAIAVTWGYCEVHPNGVNVLAENAETSEELDQQRISLALKNAEDLLGSGDLDEAGVTKYLRKADRARNRAELLSPTSTATH